jgi:hypothetical protein
MRRAAGDRDKSQGIIIGGRRCLPGVMVALLLGCAAPIKHYYPDTFFSQDNLYENKPLGFLLQYRGAWELFTDPRDMAATAREFARTLQKSGAELLFVGTTVEATQGTRGIAINLNLPALEYAQQIQKINAAEITKDLGFVDFIAGAVPAVKWEYLIGDFRFVEFFFVLDTYDIRIAFWTKKTIFDRFLPQYEDIISSITLTARR